VRISQRVRFSDNGKKSALGMSLTPRSRDDQPDEL
jgi:hypothetical protein